MSWGTRLAAGGHARRRLPTPGGASDTGSAAWRWQPLTLRAQGCNSGRWGSAASPAWPVAGDGERLPRTGRPCHCRARRRRRHRHGCCHGYRCGHAAVIGSHNGRGPHEQWAQTACRRRRRPRRPRSSRIHHRCWRGSCCWCCRLMAGGWVAAQGARAGPRRRHRTKRRRPGSRPPS